MSKSAAPIAGKPSAVKKNKPTSVTFTRVFTDELEQIERSREARGVTHAAPAKDSLIGLAFSGGGIRSATFNLGILQGLAAKGLLSKFDYLSTVSGGGYIGSWLAAIIQRWDPPGKFTPVEEALCRKQYKIGEPAEYAPVHWLRNYANYLTPQTGLFSADAGAMVGTWLRNVILNFIVLVLFLSGMILLPSVLVLATRDDLLPHPQFSLIAGACLVLVATLCMARSMMDFTPWEHQQSNWFLRNRVALSMALFFFAALLFNIGMWRWDGIARGTLQYWIPGAAVYYTGTWLLAFLMFGTSRTTPDPGKPEEKESDDKKSEEPVISWPALIFSAAGAGALGGYLLNRYASYMGAVPPNDQNIWRVVIFGTVTVMLLLQFIAVLQLGLLGRGCVDLVREWWARAGGRLLVTMITWLVVFGIVIFGPLAVRLLLGKGAVGGSVNIAAAMAWIASILAGIPASKSEKSGVEKIIPGQKADSKFTLAGLLKSPRALQIIAKVAPYVFAAGLLIILSTVIHVLMGWFLLRSETITLWTPANFPAAHLPADVVKNLYWQILSKGTSNWEYVLAAPLGLIALAGILSWRVDVNDFSMHHFYRNRLVRCYLGASNAARRPQSFTGFDPKDDVALGELKDGYPGPYPILNSALNAPHGGELGFQERKAKSFVFTPLYCGYDLGSTSGNPPAGSYLPTALGRKDKLGSNQGISLGTAMAISGAAASPNMGHYTSPATAFFMTLFDVRLGWWMGNPRRWKTWKSPGPRLGLVYLLSELVAESNEESNYVYLSDGGHFENLAIYELVKRRCRLIMACDSGADGAYSCADLMGVIEKCRTDFGVDIKISVSDIKPQSGQCVSVKNYTIGDIYYGPDPADRGMLIYVKASLPVDDVKAPLAARLAAGVRSYAEEHPDFPHQSTADQWFNEVQFESYRALGEYIATAARQDIEAKITLALNGGVAPEAAASAAGT